MFLNVIFCVHKPLTKFSLPPFLYFLEESVNEQQKPLIFKSLTKRISRFLKPDRCIGTLFSIVVVVSFIV